MSPGRHARDATRADRAHAHRSMSSTCATGIDTRPAGSRHGVTDQMGRRLLAGRPTASATCATTRGQTRSSSSSRRADGSGTGIAARVPRAVGTDWSDDQQLRLHAGRNRGHRRLRRRQDGLGSCRSTARRGTVLGKGDLAFADIPAARALTGRCGRLALGRPAHRRPSASLQSGHMAHTITLIPGDGIGPELAEATTRVLDATGIGFEWEPVEAGEAAIERYGTPLPDGVLESVRRTRVGLKGPITTPVGGGFRSVNVGLRQALGLYANLRPGQVDGRRRVALRRRRPGHRPREHRGPVRRHRAHGRPRCRREHQDHHPRGVRADRPLRLRVRGRERPAQGHGRPQGEHHEALGRALPRELPDGRGRLRRPDRVRGSHRRQHVHAARPEAGPVRRARAAEPVRRHRQRPGGRPRRWPGRRARRQHRHRGRRLRAGPRVRAQVRRPRSGQPDRDDPVRGADAPPPRLSRRRPAASRPRSARSSPRAAPRPTTWVARPGRQGFADAIIERLGATPAAPAAR